MGLGVLYLGIKRPGREVDYSPSSSADVKNPWSCTLMVYTGTYVRFFPLGLKGKSKVHPRTSHEGPEEE